MADVPGAVRERYKAGLTRTGGWLPLGIVQNLRISVNYLSLGAWMRSHGFEIRHRLPHRFRVFDHIVATVGEPLLYLEFGVFRGTSMRYWSGILSDPGSQLVGFDSFEGLPETFDERLGYGVEFHDVQGQVPVIDDPRVSFQKGRFEDTLPNFTVPEHRALVIALDADLYSSTIIALRALAEHIVPGVVIYFDDFSQIDHEPRAFGDFMAESGKRFRLLCTERSLNRPAFVCV